MIGPAELDRFRQMVTRCLGLQLDGNTNDSLAEILRERMRVRQCPDPGAYLGSLQNAAGEWQALATRLTVTETYFFRASDQFRVLAETALPSRIRMRAPGSPIRLLSAGCASGEEAYSLAILLRERFPELRPPEVVILGIDLNPAMIEKAKRARYQNWSLRETPDQLRDKYFRVDGEAYVLDNSVRAMVSFETGNLASSDWTRSGPFDIVLCRNTIMYLALAAARQAVSNITQALAPNGYLFLGYAETLRGLSQEFHLTHWQDTFYYQKREGGEKWRPHSPAPSAVEPPTWTGTPDLAWMETVRQASVRIQALSRDCLGRPTPAGAGPSPADPPEPVRRPAAELGVALERLRDEKYREALEVLRALPAEARRDPDVQVLEAWLLINCGDPRGAERVCEQILAADDLNASAHYLAALCRERAGDLGSAMEHDRAAIYLDSTFAMPHLHLGLMAKRSADWMVGRRELDSASLLFLREEPARILLFGGGFNREALIAFSRAELRSCGGMS